MKFMDKYAVPGTGIIIGKKCQYRKDHDGNSVERVAKSYTAEYRDHEGKRRFEGLGTTNKREAIQNAMAIHRQLEEGQAPARKPGKLTVISLVKRYMEYSQSKDLAPKTISRYRTALDQLISFCTDEQIIYISAFNEEAFQRLGARMRTSTHKQQATYASKSIYTTMMIIKQTIKWAVRQKIIRDNPIAGAQVPTAKPKPQPCFTDEQIAGLIERCEHLMQTDASWINTRNAIVILSHTGLRVGELVQLQWQDVLFERGESGMLHIRRGGSRGTTKSREERFLPIAPQVRTVLDSLVQTNGLVMPGLRDRTLLARVKRLCRDLHYPHTLKVHSFRHYFASRCANRKIPYRMTLEFMGHSSSSILDLYYHLEDDVAHQAMMTVAEDSPKTLSPAALRAKLEHTR